MKKRILLGSVAVVAMLFAGCGSNDSKGKTIDKPEAKSSNTAVSIKSGTYVLNQDNKVSENEGLLALEVSIKNSSKEKLSISKEDLTLYDEDGNKISGENIYTDDSSFKQIDYTSLSSGKTQNGYVIFNVEKDKKYELHYVPAYPISEEEQKAEEIELKVDPSKYYDPSEDFKKMTESYVSQVFLGKAAEQAKENEEKDTDKDEKKDKEDEVKYELSNNLTTEHNEFNSAFSERIKKMTDYYEPSTAEAEKIVTDFEAANQKKAKVTYEVAEMYPNKAIVYVRPEVISFDDVDTDAIENKFVDENRGKYDEDSDYDKIYQDAEKYILQQLPTTFEQTKISTPEYMNGEGYKVTLTKEKDKWTLDSSNSSKNYDFNQMYNGFMGGLYE
jgi:hypothetical protein